MRTLFPPEAAAGFPQSLSELREPRSSLPEGLEHGSLPQERASRNVKDFSHSPERQPVMFAVSLKT